MGFFKKKAATIEPKVTYRDYARRNLAHALVAYSEMEDLEASGAVAPGSVYAWKVTEGDRSTPTTLEGIIRDIEIFKFEFGV